MPVEITCVHCAERTVRIFNETGRKLIKCNTCDGEFMIDIETQLNKTVRKAFISDIKITYIDN